MCGTAADRKEVISTGRTALVLVRCAVAEAGYTLLKVLCCQNSSNYMCLSFESAWPVMQTPIVLLLQ